jgi:2-polyprenyl-3-methyl-5-hydroxy-6-metoxy-1,4-benzoquinol methylase
MKDILAEESQKMQHLNLDELMERIESKYSVEVNPLKIGDRTMKILQFKDFEEYIESYVESGSVGILDLPYWGKIWDASYVLAHFLGKQPVVPGQRILEIGAGIGVVGIYAALCGHNVTITDNNEDALLFAKASALLSGCPQVQVEMIDWADPGLLYPYDMIVGSEVVYDRQSYPLLVQFLRKALAPNGTIFISKNTELKTPTFFTELTKHFKFKHTTQKMRSNGETREIGLYAIRSKEEQTLH